MEGRDNPRTPPADRDAGETRTATPNRLQQLEQEEHTLWRRLPLFLCLIAVALIGHSWNSLRELPQRAFEELLAVPAAIFVLILLLAVYAWRKRSEIAQLRSFVQGVQTQLAAPASEEQVERLLEVISRSQQGYRDLIDSLDDIMFSVALDGEIRAANRSLAEAVGRPFGEIVGRSLEDLIEEPSRAELERGLERLKNRGQWTGVVRVRLRHSGSLRFMNCVIHTVLRDGEVRAISVLGRDVTREREAEARFAELFETLQEGVYFTTPEGKILDANPALVRMLGYESKEELLQVNVQDLYLHSEERPALLSELERHVALREREITLRRKDGTPVICQDTSTAIRDAYGRVIRYQGTLADITHRREMEKSLHEEKEFARRLVDSFPDLVVVLDREGRYTYVSPRIKDILGFQPEELLQKNLGDRTHEDDRPVMTALFSDLISGRRSAGSIDYRTLHKDGSWRILRATASALTSSAGQITGVIASARDLTDVRRLEQQVIQSEKLAAMGQMIAGVAHELNNPMTAILGISDLLRERTGDEPTRRQLELVQRQARRAAEIVQNLLTFARPPAPRRSRLNLAELVPHTLQLHEYSLRVNNIKLDFSPERDIPADMPPVVGDANQLMQVFLNLLVNAEQAIREVRDNGTISVRMGYDLDPRDSAIEPSVWVSITDDGPGIPAEILPKVFDPFFTTKRPGRGTGLGLSICMAILREHGGSIEARSPEGGGACFRVALPVRFTEPRTRIRAEGGASAAAPAAVSGEAEK